MSVTLAQGVARLGTKMPFAQAVADLAFFWNVDLDETTVRRHTQAAGAAYVAEQAAELEQLERERPPVADKPAVQYLSADGAMVPLVGGEWAEVKTLAIGSVELRPGKDGLPNAQTSELTYFRGWRMPRRSFVTRTSKPTAGELRWPRSCARCRMAPNGYRA